MIEFKQMKKTRKKLINGDIFVVKIEEQKFLVGQVVISELKSSSELLHGATVVHIFNKVINNLEEIPHFETKDLIIPPQIINKLGWARGYFLTVENRSLNEELNDDYGFKRFENSYFDAFGKALAKEPKICGTYALGNYLTIEDKINYILEKEPNSLKF